MELNTLVKRFDELEDERLDLSRRRTAVTTEVASHCPIKVGDTIKVPGQSYCYNGKDMRVTSVVTVVRQHWREAKYSMSWKIYGNILLANGKVGQRKHDFLMELPGNGQD